MTPLAALEVSKSYPRSDSPALNGVSVAIPAATMTAIIGPSGSGKSTLLTLLGLLDAPSSGEILVDGQAASRMSSEEQRRWRARSLGFVFQEPTLDNRRTVMENILQGLRRGGVDPSDRSRAAAAALELTGALGFAGRLPPSLSGGERQRVALTRGIAHQPRVLLCDEPTGALDHANTLFLIDLLAAIARSGTAVVVVTHDRSVAKRCQRVLSLADGRVVEGGIDVSEE